MPSSYNRQKVSKLPLGPALCSRVRVQQRRRGCRGDETLLALILALCTGGGHLSFRRHPRRRLPPAIARHCVATQEHVPVFVDGTGIEVQGHHCEGMARGYNGEKQDWLHSVVVGAAGVSARLNEGATDGQGDWQVQLETNVAPLLTAGTPVWLRADNA